MSSVSSKKVIIIAGPTAVGKTSVAIDVANHYNTEIISADSRQCYKELNIGVARPSEEQLQQVKHHFIASHSIHEKVTAATFEEYALRKTEEIFKSNNVVVMVGGTGLYIKAFTEGMDEIPDVPEAVRNEIMHQYHEKGMEWLQQEVQTKDPDFFKSGETQNPHRLMRALEVVNFTGRSILQFRNKKKVQRNFDVVKIALHLSKEMLHHNIDVRVEEMMRQGLLNEVRSLMPYRQLNALQTVGYKELFAHLNGELSLDEAIALIKKNTKQYAKRQLTWFRKDQDITWLVPENELVRNFLKENI